MQVSHLYIYPIKSLRGIEMQEAEVLEKGFRYDRRWMIVDEDSGHVTQRTHPQLSQIKVELHGESITVSHREMPQLEIPVGINQGEEIEVTVWEHTVVARVANAEINDWISKVAGEPCRLVYMSEQTSRPANPKRAKNGEHVSFADAYPYLVVSQASLDDLNGRLQSPIPMHRFRPNIVVTGTDAYAEDHWRDFQIGAIPFYGTHGCKRCVFITVDQETGKKGAEPLKTLATYRKEGNEIYFGLNAFSKKEGILKVGDAVRF